jgi:hypothetical protein
VDRLRILKMAKTLARFPSAPMLGFKFSSGSKLHLEHIHKLILCLGKSPLFPHSQTFSYAKFVFMDMLLGYFGRAFSRGFVI